MKESKKYKSTPKHLVLSIIIATVIIYLVMVLLLKYPIKHFYATVLGLLVAHLILFSGNLIGIIGVINQNFTGKTPIKFYEKAHKISKALILYPVSSTLLSAYALELIKENEPKKAIEIADEALHNSNYFAVTKSLMTNKALALYKLGKIDEAITIYLDVLKKFGKENQAFFSNEIDYSKYTKEGRADEPADEDEPALSLGKIIEENPYFTAPDYTTLAYFYILKEEINKAIFFTKLATKKDEYYAAAYDNFGQIALIQEDIAKAEKYFNKALELMPSLNDSLYFMAKICTEKDEKEKAKEYLSKIDKDKITGLSTINIKDVEELESSLSFRFED